METFSNLQRNLYSTIAKAKVNFKKSPRDRITVSYIETRLENLEADWLSFSENNVKIVSSVKSAELDKSEYCTSNLYETTKELYLDYKTELKEMLKKFDKPIHSSSGASECQSKDINTQSSIKLPKIELPVFSGNYSEWISFRDLFISLIHNNKSLDDVQKLHYLKTHLTGDAEGLLRHVAVTSGNYLVCWSQLETRYNNKKYLANCILKRFMNQKYLQVESSNGLKELLDTSNECLNALQNLGIKVDDWDILIIYILCQKLDSESRKQWETKISESPDELPKFKTFQDFLEHRFRSLEFLDNKVQRNMSSRSHSTKSYHASTFVTTHSCLFCQENHRLANCKKFGHQDIEARRKFVQTHNLCFNCMNANHSVYSCRQSNRCRFCSKKHHTLLHLKNVSNGSKEGSSAHHVENLPAATSNSESTNVVSCFSSSHAQVLLATALIKAQSNNGTLFDVRCLLDQGSQASFVTESTVQLLGLKRTSSKRVISGLGGDPSASFMCTSMVIIKIQSRIDPSFQINVEAFIMKKLTTVLPERKVKEPAVNFMSSMALADPSFDIPNKIDLLLGAEVYSQILLEGVVKDPSSHLVAQNTRLGWILSGQLKPISHSETLKNCHNIISLHSFHSDGNELLRRFWELESEPQSDFNKKQLTPDEQKCEDLFLATTKRDESGRYIVRLPFKSDDPSCRYSGSRDIAMKRFLMLEKRFIRSPDLKAQYSEVINEYLQLNHIERVPEKCKNDSLAVYLPHHAVIRNDKITTKVRVVFDASCVGSNGTSLNSDLMVGPSLQPELRHIIMRWRCYRICLNADIIKMYRQVKVADEDADFQRIYWRENPDAELQHLRHLRVTFGTSSAPYLAVRSLQQLAQDEGADFPLVKDKVLSEFYMDDLMSGCESIDEGVEIYKQLTEMLRRGGFELQKWSSNSSNLMRAIKEGQDSKDVREIKLDEISKILGLTWNKNTDEFEYTVNLPPLEPPVTKRKVISDIARLFDPLGFLAPVITIAKVFIQRLWLCGIGWDEELPASLLADWMEYRKDLCNLTNFRVPRWIERSSNDQIFELHGFSDASNLAYAAVVYARVVDSDGNVHTNLVASKTKVAPIKTISVPRLELCGAVLCAKLIHEVASILKIPKPCIHAWTDSSVVLAWLGNHPSRWKTFIANRVSEILTVTDGVQWSYVASKDNPADCASRGVKPSVCEELQLWKRGPNWLQNKVIHYEKGDIEDTKLEERKGTLKCFTVTERDQGILSRYSTLNKLIRVIAYCKRFMNITKNKNKYPKWLTTEELNKALLTCVKICQYSPFEEDIEALKKKRKLSKGSKLTSLNPFIDDCGVLRVGGRLQRADISEDMKHPILIPHNSPFTNLLIADAHERTLHGGPQLMLNYLRSMYWIINAKPSVRIYVRKCVTCVRHAAQVSQQMMGQLPEARVTPQRPFQSSGVDYAGPINLRATKGRGHHTTKGYICLFICMATKAIHLEVVSDMTAQSFLAAYKRFVSRRGRVQDLWSDNGTTFVGSAKELKYLFNAERSSVAPEIVDFLTTNGTNWHFIPPHAPNFGGLWEAGVKSTKHHLKRVIANSTLTFEEMTTVLCQIECCLNSRPLSRLPNSPEDAAPLTPGHFLVGEPLVAVPDVNYEGSNISSLRRWQLSQRMLQDFWRRWSLEYLSQLQNRYKWAHCVPEPNIGDVVLVKEDGLPPSRWLFGIIVHKHPGLDNLTRVVTLKYKNNEIKRPVSKLIVLPVTK